MSSESPTFPGVVEHIEWLGHETLAYVGVEGRHFVARLPAAQALTAGDPIRLAFDPAHLYFFDENGLALPRH